MTTVLLLNGANLNLLGKREPEIYGYETLEDIALMVESVFTGTEIRLLCAQSNSEGKLIDILHTKGQEADYIIFNPGAYSHYSYALLDAIYAIKTPVIEVHMSNIYSREEFRRHSVISAACLGQIAGLGKESYRMAARYIKEIVDKNHNIR